MPLRRLAPHYFAIQGLLVALWWMSLALRPEFRAHFQAPGGTEAFLLAFLLPDLLLLAAGSLATTYGIAFGRRWASSAAWLVAGATAYATLYCLALAAATGGAWLSVVLMVPAAILSVLFALATADASRDDLQGSRAR